MFNRVSTFGFLAAVAIAATANAGVRPAEDLSTPERAMAGFIWAYRIQDGMAMASGTAWDDPKDLRRLFLISPSDSINTVWIHQQLSALYAEAFPSDADAKKWISDVAKEIEEKDLAIADDMKKVIASIKVKIEDGVAICTTGSDGGDMLLKFKKVDGQWKLLPEFFGTEVENVTSSKALADMLNYELTDKAFTTYKTDVKAGKFKTWKQAHDALAERMLQVPEQVEAALLSKAEKEKASRESAEKK